MASDSNHEEKFVVTIGIGKGCAEGIYFDLLILTKANSDPN